MPSPSQDTVACTCPSCGNLFAVKASFLGRQVKCPICTASVTARQEEKPRPETEEQDAVPCLCHICGNSFAVRAACVGSRVECPVCHSAVTAVKREEALSTFPGRTPEAAEKAPGNPKHTAIPPSAAGVPHTSAYSAPHTPLAPKKKTDKRTISVHGPTTPGPNKSTTKSVKGKRETPLRPLPRHAAPPWPRKSRNTALPPRIPCAVNAGPPGIYGFLSRDWFFPFWACSCSCAGGIWKRKTPNF